MRLRTLAWLPVLVVVVSLGPAPGAEDTKSSLETSSKGWRDLLKDAGPGLKGWTRGPIPPKAPLRAESPWKLDESTGVLLCDGRGLHEWLRFDTVFSDLIFHVEWRYLPVTEGKKSYNSGIYVRNSANAEIWHQAQMGGTPTAYIFGETKVGGKTQRVNLSKSVLTQRVKPPGEWNVFEFSAQGKLVTLWCNGAVACQWEGCEVPSGYVGLEAEGYQIEFRKVMVKSLD